ncbi:hypothetical protein M2137_002426 [Parabacteroides sp. PFB2-10]|uniref:hypothetical protein n=1 Tax=Parabacteroides sp. PFB2-10 TaxID=1742405 RepID=UPI0024757389|nr:hypothetical protein [Parabacteroides sp. PFB2-10]MDH6313636.1 hypothetical protein [Parabacteroides sp. PFB2-10]
MKTNVRKNTKQFRIGLMNPQLTICNFGGTFRAKKRDFGDKLPGETLFNVWICKQNGHFAYNRDFNNSGKETSPQYFFTSYPTLPADAFLSLP